MKLNLLTLGHKMPDWVEQAFHFYNRRLPSHLQLNLLQLSAVSRRKQPTVEQLQALEAEQIKKAIKPEHFNLALDERGRELSTQEWAKQLAKWQMEGRDVNFIVGGADGLHQDIKQLADVRWSLSRLTFPHQLVRVIVVEQLYRAYSLLHKHPYHRE